MDWIVPKTRGKSKAEDMRYIKTTKLQKRGHTGKWIAKSGKTY